MVIPRIDVVVTTSTALDWTEAFRCPRCETSLKARVHTRSEGRGTAPYGIDREGAQARAGIRAFSAASERGEWLIKCARCPQCGHRRSKAITAMGLAKGFLAGFLFAGVFTLLPRPLSFVACAALPAVWVAVTTWQQRQAFAEADRVVVFER